MYRALLLLVFLCPPALASDEDWRVQRLNERYEDFYARRKYEQSYIRTREAGARNVREDRERWDVEMRRAREDYIRHKPPPADLGPALREWQKEQDRFLSEQETARKQYVQQIERIQRIEATAKHIPENVEYDIEP